MSFNYNFVQSTGSLQITASQIICPKHYTPPKKKKIIHHVNTSWCFICSKGGALICCESCPASFHVDCLKIPDLNPEAKYFCDNCETGRMHLYGEVSHMILSELYKLFFELINSFEYFTEFFKEPDVNASLAFTLKRAIHITAP